MAVADSIYSRPVLIAAAITVVCAGSGAYVWNEQHRDPVLEVYVFALKSGRSMFIRTPDDQRILVDGGGTSQVVQRLTDIIPFYSRRLDTIIITNTDGKNVSGLIDVVSRYDVERVYVPRYTLEAMGIASSSDEVYTTLLETLEHKHITPVMVNATDRLSIGEGTFLSILFPAAPPLFEYSKASPPEVLFTISYKDASILFIGDASKKVQKYVASSSGELMTHTDVLVVSHAVAASNMSNELMSVARPHALVYEKTVQKAGARSLAVSPHKKVADPLATILNEQRFNIRELGTVLITSDGERVEIKKAP